MNYLFGIIDRKYIKEKLSLVMEVVMLVKFRNCFSFFESSMRRFVEMKVLCFLFVIVMLRYLFFIVLFIVVGIGSVY